MPYFRPVPTGGSLSGKRVAVRIDCNITLQSASVNEDDAFRINHTMPLLEELSRRGARSIIIGHLGRPGGKIDRALVLEPVARYIAGLTNRRLQILTDPERVKSVLGVGEREYQDGKNIFSTIYLLSNTDSPTALQDGDFVLLENIRFDPREEKNDIELAKTINKLCDIYINEAFSESHRLHSSVSRVKEIIKDFYYGPLFVTEITQLRSFLDSFEKPLAVVVGGAKVETKLLLMKKFFNVADTIITGGIMANTILHAKGIAVGKSLIDTTVIEEARTILRSVDVTSTKLHLPVDVVCAPALKTENEQEVKIVPVGSIPEGSLIVDLGPDTETLFTSILMHAKSIIWNGNFGYTENPLFAHATKVLAHSMANKLHTKIIVGGGDTVAFLAHEKLLDQFAFISTGGGAMLDFLIDPENFNK